MNLIELEACLKRQLANGYGDTIEAVNGRVTRISSMSNRDRASTEKLLQQLQALNNGRMGKTTR